MHGVVTVAAAPAGEDLDVATELLVVHNEGFVTDLVSLGVAAADDCFVLDMFPNLSIQLRLPTGSRPSNILIPLPTHPRPIIRQAERAAPLIGAILFPPDSQSPVLLVLTPLSILGYNLMRNKHL